MLNILTLETQKYAIKLDNFEGPLDLLCNLIEKNKMSIYDIKLDEITDQYIEFLNKAQELNLEVASEFLTLASTLLYIKSKKLLPSKQEEEDEISEEELIRRIIEYKKYKDITEKLKQNFENNLLNTKLLFLINSLNISLTLLTTVYVSVIAIFSIFLAFSLTLF